MSGKWKPGQSGNPRGRPPGSGDVAVLRAGIAKRAPDILAKLTEAALSGDVQAARLLLERVLPPLKSVELPAAMALPVEGSLSEQARQVLAAAADGALAPDQASALIGALADLSKIIETDELRRRIERLEAVDQEGTRCHYEDGSSSSKPVAVRTVR